MGLIRVADRYTTVADHCSRQGHHLIIPLARRASLSNIPMSLASSNHLQPIIGPSNHYKVHTRRSNGLVLVAGVADSSGHHIDEVLT